MSFSLDALARYFECLRDFENNERAIDVAHNFFLAAAVMAKKPDTILELGVGTGFATFALVTAVQFNGKGHITAVDNWADWNGKEPEFTAHMRADGVEIVTATEHEFLKASPSDQYDILISDADHYNSGHWLDEHLRVARHDAFLFFHDTNSPKWPSLVTIPQRLSHLPHYHFRECSRPDERCDRGWLFVINKKNTPP